MKETSSSRVVVTRHPHGLTLLDMKSGKYWQLNATGAVVYEKLRAGQSVAETAAELVDRFDVPLDTAERDVRALQDLLSDEGLLTE